MEQSYKLIQDADKKESVSVKELESINDNIRFQSYGIG